MHVIGTALAQWHTRNFTCYASITDAQFPLCSKLCQHDRLKPNTVYAYYAYTGICICICTYILACICTLSYISHVHPYLHTCLSLHYKNLIRNYTVQ